MLQSECLPFACNTLTRRGRTILAVTQLVYIINLNTTAKNFAPPDYPSFWRAKGDGFLYLWTHYERDSLLPQPSLMEQCSNCIFIKSLRVWGAGEGVGFQVGSKIWKGKITLQYRPSLIYPSSHYLFFISLHLPCTSPSPHSHPRLALHSSRHINLHNFVP